MTPKQRNEKIHKIREQYRIDLNNLRKKYGKLIPFGYNLDLFKGELNETTKKF